MSVYLAANTFECLDLTRSLCAAMFRTESELGHIYSIALTLEVRPALRLVLVRVLLPKVEPHTSNVRVLF